MSRPEGYIVLTMEIRREEDGRWTGHCKELGTATYGTSFDEVVENLREAVDIHLNSLEDVGETKRFFAENGIILHQGTPQRRQKVCAEITTPSTFVTPMVHEINHFVQ